MLSKPKEFMLSILLRSFEVANRGAIGRAHDRRGRFHLIVHCLRRWIRDIKS
jgi:hypothetical protein